MLMYAIIKKYKLKCMFPTNCPLLFRFDKKRLDSFKKGMLIYAAELIVLFLSVPIIISSQMYLTRLCLQQIN